MLTTKRSSESAYASDRSGAVDLLERRNPANYADYTSEVEQTESFEQAKERMQRNLDHILNYEKFNTEVTDSVLVEERTEVEVMQEVLDSSDNNENIKPTSTTLQFGDGQIDQVYGDMQRQKEEEQLSYHLNRKGKFVVALYSLAVAVIMALIVLNTGVLAGLRTSNQAKVDLLNQKVAEYNAINQEIESISSNDHVINVAENDLGMIKK